HLAEFGARILEAAAEFGQRDFSGVDAFTRLLEIALAGAAAAEALLDIAEDPLVRRDVLLREGNKAGVAHDVDIGFGGIERDQLGALVRARSGSVPARSVAPNLVQRRETIEQQLTDEDRTLRAGNILAIVECRHDVAERKSCRVV